MAVIRHPLATPELQDSPNSVSPAGHGSSWWEAPGEESERSPPAFTVPKLVRDYFQGQGMSLQEYFKFPEMKQIRNPVHNYFRLGGDAHKDGHWIEEGTLPIEETEEGWMYLGAEHQELARIAVGRSRDKNYYAQEWGDSYMGPILRTTSAAITASVYIASGTFAVTGMALRGIASIVHTSRPYIPPADAPLVDRFVEESVRVNGETWYFRVWLPPNLEKIKKENGGLPAFLLLHGFKECGWDNWWQTNSGLALNLQNRNAWAEWFPGILVLPQLPRRPWDEQWWQHWREPAMQQMAVACLEHAVAKYGADRQRLYALGESLGTEGAWYLAASRPGLFAAVGGSCGSVEPYDWMNWEWGAAPNSYKKLAVGIGRDTPMWFCHGTQDDFVPVEQSQRFYAALQESRMVSAVGAILGRSEAAEVVFKEYEDLDHHVWDRAYSEDDMIQWLVSQRAPIAPSRVCSGQRLADKFS